jgi:hypothetical protein
LKSCKRKANRCRSCYFGPHPSWGY